MNARGFVWLMLLALCSIAGIAQAPSASAGPPVNGNASKPNTNLDTSRALLKEEKFSDAERALRAELAQNQLSADAHFLLGYTLFREEKAKESLTEYTQAAHLRTPTAEDLRFVALDYVLLNDYADANKWMSQAVEWEPNNFEAWYALGRIRYTLNKFQQSVDCFHRALELQPGSVKAENNLGLAYEGLGQVDDAVSAYRTAIEWQAHAEHPSEQPLLNLAIVLINRGRLAEALPLLTQASSIAPKDPKIREQLGRLYLREQKLSDAQQQLEQAVALDPNSAPLHFQLGQVYHREGANDKANAEFARAAALNGTHSTPARD